MLKRWLGHESRGIYGLAFAPDGKQAVSSGGDQQVLLWDVEQGVVLKKMNDHTDSIRSVAFAPGGQLAASGSLDGTIRLWDLKTGDSRAIPAHKDGVYSVAFSSDGKRLLSSSADEMVRLWNVADGREIRSFRGHHNTNHHWP